MPVKLYRAWSRDIGLDSLMGQRNAFEDFKITKLRKISLKFAIVFKLFDLGVFLSCSEFNYHYCPTSFLKFCRCGK